MGIEIDTSEVRELIADMSAVDSRLARHLKPVVAKGAQNIKAQLRSEMAASKHFKSAARSISYDIDDDGFGAEIGPEASGGGTLANIAYFGGSGWSGRKRPGPGWQQGPGGGGTVADPVEALNAETPRFLEALADAAEGAIFT